MVDKILKHLAHQKRGVSGEQFGSVNSQVFRVRAGDVLDCPLRGDVVLDSKVAALVASSLREAFR